MLEPWIAFTLAAALLQSIRFMLQKRLSDTGLSAVGATFARFAFAAPVAGVALLAWLTLEGRGLPSLSGTFWAYAVMAGSSQILATICVVALFKQRNFAVGITFKKSEVLQTAFLGLVMLGDAISQAGGIALAIGVIALLILSESGDGATGETESSWLARFATRSAGLGFLSGALFAMSAVGVRGATLQVLDVSTGLRALVTLSMVTAMQASAMLLWFLWRDRQQPVKVLRAWRAVALTGAASLGGSFCWFAAFSLQTAAYVYALGQVEILFSMVIGALILKERLRRQEVLGIVLLMISIVVLVLYG